LLSPLRITVEDDNNDKRFNDINSNPDTGTSPGTYKGLSGFSRRIASSDRFFTRTPRNVASFFTGKPCEKRSISEITYNVV
jgi:hypothetical protein